MQRTIGLLAAVSCVLVMAAPPALADMSGTFEDSFGSTNGGEFIFNPTGDYDGLSLGSFTTFCLETIEYMDFSQTFDVLDISDGAVEGGKGGGNPDILDERTAWLYQSFRDGTLGGLTSLGYAHDYDYGTGSARVASANAIQNVIWGLEDEFGDSWTPAAGLETTFLAAATDLADGLGNVRVLNIAWPDGALAQSQLVIVPVPGAVVLGACGLGLVGVVRRRFR
ncbi:MAG: hypothetical protein JSU63_11980 [Phycisphaerales bacterium]|nr:MAG: hypothetical protein JSU63_11980 [Phycisphaerales bacterium]